MRGLLTLIVFVSILPVFSQTIEESVSFINEAVLESTKSAEKALLVFKITVNANGKLIKDTYLIISGNERLIESRSAYLKALNFKEFKEMRFDNSTNYVLILKCKSPQNCVTRQVRGYDGDNVSEIAFTFYNKYYAERAKNALIHILELAKSKDNYLFSDPF